VTVYQPDEAQPDLSLSRIRRGTLIDEREAREAVPKALEKPEQFKLRLVDKAGRRYLGRITGTLIWFDDKNSVAMYRTEDERVIFHDEEKASYWQVEDADLDETLRNTLDQEAYFDAMTALGRIPEVDL
jgi:hypothetical protein